MEINNIKIGDRVRVSDAYKVLTGIDMPIQTIKRIEGSFFWSDHIKAGRLKHLKSVFVDGEEVKIQKALDKS